MIFKRHYLILNVYYLKKGVKMELIERIIQYIKGKIQKRKKEQIIKKKIKKIQDDF